MGGAAVVAPRRAASAWARRPTVLLTVTMTAMTTYGKVLLTSTSTSTIAEVPGCHMDRADDGFAEKGQSTAAS